MAGLEPAIQLHIRRMPSGFVYILASKPYGTLYIGVTSDLMFRMEQHHRGAGSKFVKKYGVNRLVYFEEHPLYADAIRRETSLKRWRREWKIALIEKVNPQWCDLLENWNR
jgi:putative endonuclease